MTTRSSRLALLPILALLLPFGSGCELRQAMFNQPKYEAYAESDFFGDRRSARPLVKGTIAQGELKEDEHLYEGLVDGEQATTFPIAITREVLVRGQERFNIYCSPCHDRAGTGNGMIVQRGFRQPQTYHSDRLRDAAPGYFYGVIKNGFGVMSSYSYQVPRAEDRWAIVAYIRALQLAQHATLEDVPEDQRASLE